MPFFFDLFMCAPGSGALLGKVVQAAGVILCTRVLTLRRSTPIGGAIARRPSLRSVYCLAFDGHSIDALGDRGDMKGALPFHRKECTRRSLRSPVCPQNAWAGCIDSTCAELARALTLRRVGENGREGGEMELCRCRGVL